MLSRRSIIVVADEVENRKVNWLTPTGPFGDAVTLKRYRGLSDAPVSEVPVVSEINFTVGTDFTTRKPEAAVSALVPVTFVPLCEPVPFIPPKVPRPFSESNPTEPPRGPARPGA